MTDNLEINRHREAIVEFINPYKSSFFNLIAETFSKPFVSTDKKIKSPQYPYQIIGGDALFFMNSMFPVIEQENLIRSPDIDIQVAPLIEEVGGKNKPIVFYEPITNEEKGIVSRNGVRFPYQVITRGKYKDTILKVNNACLEYVIFISNIIKNILINILTSTDLNNHIEHVNPALDPESVNEHPDLSYDVERVHVSVIFDVNFITKIQILINYKGTIEHIVEFIFYNSSRSVFFTEITNFEPFIINDILIASSVDLLKQNIEALTSRIKKKIIFDSEYSKAPTNNTKKQQVIHIHTKLNNTIERIGVLILINQKYLETIKQSAGLDYIKFSLFSAFNYLLDQLKTIQVPLSIMKKICMKLTLHNNTIEEIIANNGLYILKLSELCSNYKEPEKQNEPWTNVKSRAKAPNAIPMTRGPILTGHNFSVLKEEGELEDEPQVIRDVVASVPTKRGTKPSIPSLNNITAADLEALLEPYVVRKKDPLRNFINIDCVIIKEPSNLKQPTVELLEVGSSADNIQRVYRETLVSILNFINERTPNFLFVYIMPSEIYTYYKIEPSLDKNIIYEEPCFYHFYKLFRFLHIFNFRKTITVADLIKTYNLYLLTLEQLRINKMLSDDYIKSRLEECNESFVNRNIRNKNINAITKKLVEVITTILLDIIWPLIEKYDLKKLYKNKEVLDRGITEYKQGKRDIYPAFLLIRCAILNRMIEERNINKSSIYLFSPLSILSTENRSDEETEVIWGNLLDLLIMNNFKFLSFPNPSYKTLVDNKIIKDEYKLDKSNTLCLEYNAHQILITPNLIDITKDENKKFLSFIFNNFKQTLLNDEHTFLNVINSILLASDTNINRMTKLKLITPIIEDKKRDAGRSLLADMTSHNINLLLYDMPDLRQKYHTLNKEAAINYVSGIEGLATRVKIIENSDIFLANLDIISSNPLITSEELQALFPDYKKYVYNPNGGGSRKQYRRNARRTRRYISKDV